jgi:uncharacterized heparinase superfamily protein
MVSAMDRLAAALRFQMLSDGRLASFHGGEAVEPERVRAALNEDVLEAPAPSEASHSGYHRLDGTRLHLMVDTAAPASGAWSTSACAAPAALEVTADQDRLFCGGGWSSDAAGPQAMRLTAAATTLQVAQGSAGRPLTGFRARALGARLVGAAVQVAARREENETGVWLELTHDGWVADYGLSHDRRLFVSRGSDEIRGEDVLIPAPGRPARTAVVPFAVRFQVWPDVEASLARDGRSILLRGSSGHGWWFRNDAPQVTLEPSVCFRGGLPRRTVQVVLHAEVGAEGARVRWKLGPVEPPPPRPRSRAGASATGDLATTAPPEETEPTPDTPEAPSPEEESA